MKRHWTISNWLLEKVSIMLTTSFTSIWQPAGRVSWDRQDAVFACLRIRVKQQSRYCFHQTMDQLKFTNQSRLIHCPKPVLLMSVLRWFTWRVWSTNQGIKEYNVFDAPPTSFSTIVSIVRVCVPTDFTCSRSRKATWHSILRLCALPTAISASDASL